MAEAALTQEIRPPRRFGLGDLHEMAPWLAERLRERYPQATPKSLVGWLNGVLISNEHFFQRTENAVLLAQISHVPLDPTPIVEEVFMLSRGDATDETRMLYTALRVWAHQVGASEIEVCRFSDASRDVIKEAMGSKMYARQRLVFTVPKS